MSTEEYPPSYKELVEAVQHHVDRADKAEARIKELEATLRTLAAQAMYALKKGDCRNETL